MATSYPKSVSVKGIFSHPHLRGKGADKPKTSKEPLSSKKSDKKVTKKKHSSSSKGSLSKALSKDVRAATKHGAHTSIARNTTQGKRGLLDQFTESLETTRQGIVVNTAASLQDTKSTLESRLHQFAKSHSTKLADYQAKREILISAVQHAENDAADASNDNTKALASFSDAYRKEKKALSKLWKEWSKVQRKMICLGIEVLGQGASLEEVVQAAGGDDMKKSYKERVVEAFTAYQEQKGEEERVQSEERQCINDVRKLCAETKAGASTR
ncbi:hypothetical protein KEM56_003502, partial [Ascosphaera pollenicola]